ncbi:hypothetical protein [Actinoplanes sp. G11-F43]|uniref:hypothetical protein n=1 Tax=Actinoplanes sp. G11-F43 TaxID=3424130 RepID=UPI003D328546
MRLGVLVFHLTRRRRMYLPDDSFASLVAFIEGFSAGTDQSLSGFQPWVAERVLGHCSNRVWWTILIEAHPMFRDVPTPPVGRLPDEVGQDLVGRTIELLTAFATERGDPPPERLPAPGEIST